MRKLKCNVCNRECGFDYMDGFPCDVLVGGSRCQGHLGWVEGDRDNSSLPTITYLECDVCNREAHNMLFEGNTCNYLNATKKCRGVLKKVTKFDIPTEEPLISYRPL